MNYKIVFYVPEASKERVKEAMFAAGAGHIGKYKKCSFDLQGTGQFMACDGAIPAIGEIGKLELVKEFRVEMICPQNKLKEVISAMRLHHPYEEVAFDVIELVWFES